MVQDRGIDLLRHGEPVGGRRYRGQIDDPLSENGWQQMWRAVDGQGPWQQIITSPLQRCSAFSQELSQRDNIPICEDARLKEVGFGVWEGLTSAQLREQDADRLQRFYHDPENARPDGAEPLEDFIARVSAAFEEVIEDTQDGVSLVVVHAGVIRVILANVLQAPASALYRISVPTAALIRIQLGEERPPTLMFPATKE